MDRGRTRRRPALRIGLVVVLMGLASMLGTGVALAGSGCHSEGFADQAGDHVDLVDNCFTPTVLRVQPGDTVTWANKDPVEHTVTGANGSFGDDRSLFRSDTVAYTFDTEGVFPYFCYLHPGMVGAVVVGDGAGPGSGAGVAPAGSGGEGDGAAGAAAPEAQPASDQDAARGLWAGLGLGLGLVAAASVGSVAISRRRKRLSSRTPAAA